MSEEHKESQALQQEFPDRSDYIITDCGIVEVDRLQEIVSDIPRQYAVYIGDDNQPVFPAELIKMLGLKKGSTVKAVLTDNTVELSTGIDNLSRLYIEPTTKCNLSCQTCIRKTWGEPLGSMDRNDFDALVEQIKDIDTLRSVMFGGYGEPMFHPDILYMIERIKSLGLTVEITTNGTLLNKEMIDGLIRSGLDTLWVSFDGTSPEIYEDIRAGASFQNIVQNLLCLKRTNRDSIHKIKVGIAFVLMKKNIEELNNLGLLSKKIGAQMISVSNVIPYSKEMIDQMVCDLVTRTARKRFGASIHINMPLVDMTDLTSQPLFEFFRDNKNISIMKNAVWPQTPNCRFISEGCSFIRWDGKVSPCMGLLHSHKTYFYTGKTQREIKPYLVGDIKTDRLNEIWDSCEYREFREKVYKFDFPPCIQCGICDLAETNEEDCEGNSFPTCGGCLWAQGVIQCP